MIEPDANKWRFRIKPSQVKSGVFVIRYYVHGRSYFYGHKYLDRHKSIHAAMEHLKETAIGTRGTGYSDH